MAALIGRSVSFCVCAVLDGRVPEGDIVRIIAGTCLANEADWKELEESYSRTYWRKNPQEGVAILRRLIAAGKIDQPRLRGEPYPMIGSGYIWQDEATGKIFRFTLDGAREEMPEYMSPVCD